MLEKLELPLSLRMSMVIKLSDMARVIMAIAVPYVTHSFGAE
jgi:hypothetical protein